MGRRATLGNTDSVIPPVKALNHIERRFRKGSPRRPGCRLSVRRPVHGAVRREPCTSSALSARGNPIQLPRTQRGKEKRMIASFIATYPTSRRMSQRTKPHPKKQSRFSLDQLGVSRPSAFLAASNSSVDILARLIWDFRFWILGGGQPSLPHTRKKLEKGGRPAIRYQSGSRWPAERWHWPAPQLTSTRATSYQLCPFYPPRLYAL
jgi:hypothetical protein